jgi:hypothetical protein
MVKERQGPFLITRKFFGKEYTLATIEYTRSAQKEASAGYRRRGYLTIETDAISGSIGGDTEYAVYIRKASRESVVRSITRIKTVEKKQKKHDRESLRWTKRMEKDTLIRSYNNREDAKYYAKAQNWAYNTNYYVRKEGNRFVVRRRKK